jgi:hypothetical protein
VLPPTICWEKSFPAFASESKKGCSDIAMIYQVKTQLQASAPLAYMRRCKIRIETSAIGPVPPQGRFAFQEQA